jgi:hypothetical protein
MAKIRFSAVYAPARKIAYCWPFREVEDTVFIVYIKGDIKLPIEGHSAFIQACDWLVRLH